MLFDSYIVSATKTLLSKSLSCPPKKLNCSMGFKRFAFTLAETLITLTIIGVIAVFTLPTLINKYNEKITVAKVKKVYYMLDQSFQKAVLTYGPVQTWDLEKSVANTYDENDKVITVGTSPSSQVFLEKLLIGIKVKDIEGTKNGCHRLNGQTANCIMRFVSDDNILFYGGFVTDPKCKTVKGTSAALSSICGELAIDINGKKEPNTLGSDQFVFHITRKGIIPMGSPSDNYWTPEEYCNPNIQNRYNGYACTGWLIQNEERPWLKGKGVSWKTEPASQEQEETNT